MSTRELSADATRRLRTEVDGQLVEPGDEGYEAARTVWNERVDKHPAAVVRSSGPADVVAAVAFARERDIPLSVKGGGHHLAGTAVVDDGLVIDMSMLDGVDIDAEARRATVGAGATWGEFYEAAAGSGLTTAGGVHPGTGVAGLTLGGGLGLLGRKHGLTVDNLVGATVVTADGRIVRAAADENSDLFWALRGGGGNFGVVTEFEFRLHDIGPEVVGGKRLYAYREPAAMLRAYRSVMADAPDELMCMAGVRSMPPHPRIPEPVRGTEAFTLLTCFAGPTDAADEALEALGELGDPLVDGVRPRSYTGLVEEQSVPDDYHWYSKARYLDELTDDAIDTIASCTESPPPEFSRVTLEPMGGAISRVDDDETAFAHRDAGYSFSVWTGWTEPALEQQHVEWTRAFHDAMEPHATDGVYLNYLDRDDGGRVGDAFGGHGARLREIKDRWDPDGLFRIDRGMESRG
ncbi:FAD-binding oxidoreductase [Haloarcula sp. S1CR25-12]|uniref:FAD-binding oxidoreductase n=1 Tax=Haloarcula saliterrae TaxID=2950534 RepID=A0ABU2FDJ8_9EURY|nr:FAD-binding oxidoreductase [Haloarcula sp. S1CR25-12]MDS0260336.1 FAD-binding oxidoreductase [Haloarcula sp. S1CR25-12]